MRWFGVALWIEWPALCPDHFAYIEASSAFEAVEWFMCSCGRAVVARATAIALDGSLRYRAYGVDLG